MNEMPQRWIACATQHNTSINVFRRGCTSCWKLFPRNVTGSRVLTLLTAIAGEMSVHLEIRFTWIFSYCQIQNLGYRMLVKLSSRSGMYCRSLRICNNKQYDHVPPRALVLQLHKVRGKITVFDTEYSHLMTTYAHPGTWISNNWLNE